MEVRFEMNYPQQLPLDPHAVASQQKSPKKKLWIPALWLVAIVGSFLLGRFTMERELIQSIDLLFVDNSFLAEENRRLKSVAEPPKFRESARATSDDIYLESFAYEEDDSLYGLGDKKMFVVLHNRSSNTFDGGLTFVATNNLGVEIGTASLYLDVEAGSRVKESIHFYPLNGEVHTVRIRSD